MAMDVGGAKGGVKSDINVTPLVDVMLVLLIIMMIDRAAAAAGRRRSRCPTRRTRPTSRTRRTRRSSSWTRTSKFYINTVEVGEDRRRPAAPERPRGQGREDGLSQGRQGRAVRRHHEDDGRAPQGADRHGRAHHRAAGRQRPTGRGAANVARPHAPRRRARRHGSMPAGLGGHERHAAHRRAARAARHLHGGPAAHPEGRGHQPARSRSATRRSRPTSSARSSPNTRPITG